MNVEIFFIHIYLVLDMTGNESVGQGYAMLTSNSHNMCSLIRTPFETRPIDEPVHDIYLCI
jgi:hypothetical protein